MKQVYEYDHWLAAVQQDGKALGDVPDHLKTPELCLIAVQQDSTALAYVPDHLKTPDLCRIADQGL